MAQKPHPLSKQEVKEYKKMIALIDRMRDRESAIDPLWLVGRKQLVNRLNRARSEKRSQTKS